MIMETDGDVVADSSLGFKSTLGKIAFAFKDPGRARRPRELRRQVNQREADGDQEPDQRVRVEAVQQLDAQPVRGLHRRRLGHRLLPGQGVHEGQRRRLLPQQLLLLGPERPGHPNPWRQQVPLRPGLGLRPERRQRRPGQRRGHTYVNSPNGWYCGHRHAERQRPLEVQDPLVRPALQGRTIVQGLRSRRVGQVVKGEFAEDVSTTDVAANAAPPIGVGAAERPEAVGERAQAVQRPYLRRPDRLRRRGRLRHRLVPEALQLDERPAWTDDTVSAAAAVHGDAGATPIRVAPRTVRRNRIPLDAPNRLHHRRVRTDELHARQLRRRRRRADRLEHGPVRG